MRFLDSHIDSKLNMTSKKRIWLFNLPWSYCLWANYKRTGKRIKWSEK
jgi:hypothetical protein